MPTGEARVAHTRKQIKRKECGHRFHPLLHTSYTMDFLTAPLGEDVSSGHYVQSESQ